MYLQAPARAKYKRKENMVMFPFMLVINGTPLPENHNYNTVGGAKIHIWVMDNDADSAQEKAESYVKQYLWKIQSVEHVLQISPEQLHHLHEAEALLYQKALRNGIAADFLAYPRVDGNPDDPILIGRP